MTDPELLSERSCWKSEHCLCVLLKNIESSSFSCRSNDLWLRSHWSSLRSHLKFPFYLGPTSGWYPPPQDPSGLYGFSVRKWRGHLQWGLQQADRKSSNEGLEVLEKQQEILLMRWWLCWGGQQVQVVVRSGRSQSATTCWPQVNQKSRAGIERQSHWFPGSSTPLRQKTSQHDRPQASQFNMPWPLKKKKKLLEQN